MARWSYRVTAQGARLSMTELEFDGIPAGATMSAHRLGDVDFLVIVDSDTQPTSVAIKNRTCVTKDLTDAEAKALRGI